MMLFQLVLPLLLLAESILATVPLVLYSYKLVPKVQTYVSHHNKYIFPRDRVDEVITNLVSPCSSNAYILVNQPGLTLDDLQDHEGYKFLRTYSFMASTLGTMPRIESAVDFDELKRTIVRKCDATVVELAGFEEVKTYIDTKTRLISINLPELPQEPEARKEALILADDAIRRTVRKLPSPSHTLIYTTLDKRLFDKYNEKQWEKLDIFPDIVKQDATRDYEYERNDRSQQVERPFPEKRTNLLNPDKLRIPSFLDKELILENELLVISVLLIIFVLILMQLVQTLFHLTKKIASIVKRDLPEEVKEKKNK